MVPDDTAARGLSAQEFFARALPGANMTEAQLATRIAYSTIHRASKGEPVSARTAFALERWSRDLGIGVFISAVACLTSDTSEPDDASRSEGAAS